MKPVVKYVRDRYPDLKTHWSSKRVPVKALALAAGFAVLTVLLAGCHGPS
jgi:hypothetical protein